MAQKIVYATEVRENDSCLQPLTLQQLHCNEPNNFFPNKLCF